MARPAGVDPRGLAVVLAGRVDEPASVQPEVGKMPADGPDGDHGSFAGQIDSDASRGPLPLPAHRLDPEDDLRGRGGGLVVRDAGPVKQTSLAELAVTVDPLRRALPGDPHLGSNMGDRTGLTPLHETATAFHGQRDITVGHRTGLSTRRIVGRTSILPPKDPSPRLSPYPPTPTS